MKHKLERKVFEIKALTDSNGMLEGYAAVTGNIDQGGDVILPGAFTNIQEFIQKGFITFNHDWDDKPIGMVIEAREDDRGLFIKIAFHDTSDAQECRKIVLERVAAGKFVGLSIGYLTVESSWETREGEEVRILKAVKLFETAITITPMNEEATVTAAKGLDEGSQRSQLDTHLDDTLLAVADAVDHLISHKEMKDGNNRRVSPERVEQAERLSAKLTELIASMKADEPATPAPSFDPKLRYTLAKAKIATAIGV